MPSERLILCGLLSKYPKKSWVFQKIINPRQGVSYTDAEKMHIVGLMFTPELPKSWIWHQFKPFAKTSERNFMLRLRRVAYNHHNRERWGHIGQRNLMHIGQPEVLRYYQRSDPDRYFWHPNWAIPHLVQHVKDGMKMTEIEAMYGLPANTMQKLRRRNIMLPHTKGSGSPLYYNG